MLRTLTRFFTTSRSALIKKNKFPPRPKINEDEITEVFIKGGGKGGQKINKTNSKVQLKHIPTGIVVDSQFSRSREDNRKRAREILAAKLDEMINGENSRAQIVAQYHIQKARKKKQKARKRQRERESTNSVTIEGDERILEERTNTSTVECDRTELLSDISLLRENASDKKSE